LFYVNGADQMMSVPITEKTADIVPGRATTLFDASAWVNAAFAVVGDRFLAVTTAAEGSAAITQLDVVLNWFDALERNRN
jgi:hypothetical protein